MRSVLDQGYRLRTPDGILINGQGPLGTTFTVVKGTSGGLGIGQCRILGLYCMIDRRYRNRHMCVADLALAIFLLNFTDTLKVDMCYADTFLSALTSCRR